jgi:lysyl-tRNA synthetase class 2
MPEPVHPDQYEAQRRAKRDETRVLGLNPYGRRTENLLSLRDAFERFDQGAAEEHAAKSKEPGYTDRRPEVTVAGRVVLHRDNGKLVWMNLRDHTRDLQIAVSQKDVADLDFKLAKLTDLGDILVCRGRLMKTRTGEVTVWANSLEPGAKSLVTPPAKHDGLQDVELRYRQRYVDLWANPDTLRVFQLRSRLVSRLRDFLAGRGYLEVETPMLQTLAGGAAARPFKTHMNALDINLFLRIAPELYLKRLLVGGLPRVFEVNRNFRNEGLDKQHNPEFTMLEAYHAFGDCETVMELTESLVRELARVIAAENGASDLVLPFGDLRIDYGPAFERVTYASLFERSLGFPMTDAAKAREAARSRHVLPADEIGKLDDIFIVNELFEEFAEKSLDLSRPTFITEYPAALSPLTRPKADNPLVAERADLFIAGMEIAPHYTELNDPDVQESKFREQLKGLDDEESTFRTFDQDFIDALKVGMPPAGGMGLGIDRLVMVLTDQRTIRDVVLFPLMRPSAPVEGQPAPTDAG